jgi:F-type H+-transporting ATPase subunit delta
MASDPLVRAYAESLFHVARAEEMIDRVEEELTHLNKALDANAELREFLSNPNVSSDGKKDALVQIFGKTVSPVTLHWVNMVMDQGRQRRLPVIIEDFMTLAQEAREKVTAEVITSVPLTEDLAKSLEAELSRVTKKRVFLKPLVDESILGGVIVKLENKVIDGSVRHRLDEIKREMTKTF